MMFTQRSDEEIRISRKTQEVVLANVHRTLFESKTTSK